MEDQTLAGVCLVFSSIYSFTSFSSFVFCCHRKENFGAVLGEENFGAVLGEEKENTNQDQLLVNR